MLLSVKSSFLKQFISHFMNTVFHWNFTFLQARKPQGFLNYWHFVWKVNWNGLYRFGVQLLNACICLKQKWIFLIILFNDQLKITNEISTKFTTFVNTDKCKLEIVFYLSFEQEHYILAKLFEFANQYYRLNCFQSKCVQRQSRISWTSERSQASIFSIVVTVRY